MRCANAFLLAAAVAAVFAVFAVGAKAQAQCAAPAVAYYPAQPVVTYLPERRGLLFPRVVYRPVVTYAASPVAVSTYYAPAPAPVVRYYAPTPVVRYYAPIFGY